MLDPSSYQGVHVLPCNDTMHVREARSLCRARWPPGEARAALRRHAQLPCQL